MPYRRLLAASLLVAAFALIGVTLALPHLRVLAVAVALASQDRSGQTFFTWQGQPGVAVRYRIYRHNAAINAANLASTGASPTATPTICPVADGAASGGNSHADGHAHANRRKRLPGDPQRDNQ